MAFSDAEKDAIAGYLAWSCEPDDRAVLNAAIAKVEAVAPAETRLKSYLTTLAAIEGQIVTARNAVGSAYDQLLAEAQRYCYLIGNALGVEVKKKVFR